MLGKLAKKLRMLGIDAACKNLASDENIISSAINENRIILSRRTDFQAADKNIHFLFIKDNSPDSQIRQVISSLKITRKMIKPFCRCICCSTELQPLGKKQAEGKVADYVFNTVDAFSICPSCNKIYWPGTHYQNMLNTIDDIFRQP